KSEKPDLNSSGEYPSVDRETNGSEKSNSHINLLLTATDTSSFNEAGKLDIEKITRGPYDAHQVLSGEPDELEDDLQYRNQIKDFGGNLKNGNLDSSNSESVVAAEPVQKENISSTHIYSNGGLEELEIA
ncbi:poly(A) polymerase-like protein, partial [Trifolium medium]|nr:poly(A) polymerase-like protein [Trifolium medium]